MPPQLPAAGVFAGWFDRPIQVGGRCAGHPRVYGIECDLLPVASRLPSLATMCSL